jgi:uncharacterized protein (TIGR03545 family)
MRKKFIYYVFIPAVIVCIVVYLFIDSWIELALEYRGEKAVGAKVEIDNLHISINPLGIEFARMQVTDPNDGWKNFFETGKVKFALNFGQLLRGKYIIETMEVNNLILGTKRITDGSILKPKEEKPAAQTQLTEQGKPALAPQESKSSISFDLDKIKRELKIDSLLDPKNLASYRLIDTLKNQINDASVQWKVTLSEIDKSKAKVADIETRAKAIDVNNIKTIQAASDALNNANSILTTASEIKTTFQTQKTLLTDDINKFNESIKSIDDVVNKDLRNILNMAHLPDVSMKGLAEMILGKEILSQAYEYLGYVETAKSKIQNSSDKPPIETPARFKGQNIHFPIERAYPKMWIKKVLISGGTDKSQDPQYFYAKGEVLNITNDQRITGFPLTVDLSATKAGTTTLALGASIDRRKELPVDKYNAVLTGLPLKQMSLGQSNFLPATITNASANASITVDVPGNQFDSHTIISINNMNLVFQRDPQSMVERIVRDVLAAIHGFNVDLRIWRNQNKFDVAFATDLDDKLASSTKKVLGDEIIKIQNDLRNKLNAKIAEKRAELEKLYNEKREMVMNKVKEYEALVNEKLAMVESKKKEIENRIDQEKKKQTDDATKKAKDALKDIFK